MFSSSTSVPSGTLKLKRSAGRSRSSTFQRLDRRFVQKRVGQHRPHGEAPVAEQNVDVLEGAPVRGHRPDVDPFSPGGSARAETFQSCEKSCPPKRIAAGVEGAPFEAPHRHLHQIFVVKPKRLPSLMIV